MEATEQKKTKQRMEATKQSKAKQKKRKRTEENKAKNGSNKTKQRNRARFSPKVPRDDGADLEGPRRRGVDPPACAGPLARVSDRSASTAGADTEQCH